MQNRGWKMDKWYNRPHYTTRTQLICVRVLFLWYLYNTILYRYIRIWFFFILHNWYFTFHLKVQFLESTMNISLLVLTLNMVLGSYKHSEWLDPDELFTPDAIIIAVNRDYRHSLLGHSVYNDSYSCSNLSRRTGPTKIQ